LIEWSNDLTSGPLEAFVQADVINTHALKATGGKTYAQLDKEDPLRATAMNGSFLRSSLFTSVIAFGVALFAIGVGVLALLRSVAGSAFYFHDLRGRGVLLDRLDAIAAAALGGVALAAGDDLAVAGLQAPAVLAGGVRVDLELAHDLSSSGADVGVRS